MYAIKPELSEPPRPTPEILRFGYKQEVRATKNSLINLPILAMSKPTSAHPGLAQGAVHHMYMSSPCMRTLQNINHCVIESSDDQG